MDQPLHDLRSHAVLTQATPRRFITLGAVAALHVVLIFALVEGLRSGVLEKIPQEIKAEVEIPKLDKTPPPPPPELQKPPPPFVPPPEITITTEAPATNAITVTNKPPPPAAPKAVQITPSKAIGRTHNCLNKYYPEVSIRLNETGTSTVAYDIGVDGTISNAHLTHSSGIERLDNAAVNCVSNQFRNTPEMNGNIPVATHSEVNIVWTLK